jgi:hypothetical protein
LELAKLSLLGFLLLRSFSLTSEAAFIFSSWLSLVLLGSVFQLAPRLMAALSFDSYTSRRKIYKHFSISRRNTAR